MIGVKNRMGASKIAWVNIDKPTKKCTLHTDCNCQYVINMKETPLKGIESMKRDGGWYSFISITEAKRCCREWAQEEGYRGSKCC